MYCGGHNPDLAPAISRSVSQATGANSYSRAYRHQLPMKAPRKPPMDYQRVELK